jgi:hypothetical protein
MTEPQQLVENYLVIWNEQDSTVRRTLIAKTWDPTATYVDPMQEASGHDDIDRMVAGFQLQFPGLIFRHTGETEAHHDRIRFRWELHTHAGDLVAAGTDVAVINGGRLQTVTGFFDQAPVLDAA